MEQTKPVRLIFLDIMRFIALFMMIQGHTIYALLNTEIRDGSSFHIWTLLRGYTAPFFMIIAGAVFTFLLLQQDRTKVKGNVRIKKGLLRVVTLLFWGYLLHFQWQSLSSPVSQGLIDNIVSVDVLHMIGLGLLAVIGVYVVARRQIGLLALVFLTLFFTVVFLTPKFTKQNYHEHPELLLSYNQLGVELIGNYKDSVLPYHSTSQNEVFVQSVRGGSKAEAMGIQSNDVLVAMGYQNIDSISGLYLVETRQMYNTFADIVVVRGGDTLKVPYLYERRAKVFPNALTMWVNSKPTYAGKTSLFPIFPWLSYILFGAFFGAILAWMKDRGTLFKFLELKLLAIGLFFIALSMLGTYMELQWYGKNNFWGVTQGMGSSFTLVFHRIAVVILVGSVCAFLARFIKQLPTLMNQMSRNTLWLYVGHLIVLYVVRPKFNNERFDVIPVMFFVALMYALMIIQTLIIEKKNEFKTWRAYLKFTFGKLKELLPLKR